LAGRAISAEIGCQSLSDIGRQRHSIMKQPLAANEDFASSPVDVLEWERHHFTGAKAETGKQKKDGIVAAAVRSAAVAGPQQALDFLRSQVLRHGGPPPIRHPWH